MIGLNIVKSCYESNVKKLINLGSACIYPKETNQPIKEGLYYHQNLKVQMRDMLSQKF